MELATSRGEQQGQPAVGVRCGHAAHRAGSRQAVTTSILVDGEDLQGLSPAQHHNLQQRTTAG
jgi:hypothetical protein